MQVNPIACRRAVLPLTSPSSHHIWVSDELLAQTFHRFLRIQGHQTRHGSNVPGPLEARRRGVKRRMTVVASSQTGLAPSPFSIAALFGFGSSNHGQTWRYEPPSIGTCREPLKPPPEPPQPLGAVGFPGLEYPASTIPPPPPIPEFLNQHQTRVQRQNTKLADATGNGPQTFHITHPIDAFRLSVNEGTPYERVLESYLECSSSRTSSQKFILSAVEHLRRFWDLGSISRLLSEPHVQLLDTGSLETDVFIKQILSFPLKSSLSETAVHFKTLVSKFLVVNRGGPRRQSNRHDVLRTEWNTGVLLSAENIISSPEGDILRKSQASLGSHYILKNLLHIQSVPHQAENHIAGLITDITSRRAVKKGEYLACVLKAVPRRLLSGWIPAITSGLLEPSASTLGSNPASVKNRVEKWLGVTRILGDHHTSTGAPSDLSILAYDALAAQGMHARTHLGRHLAKLDSKRLAKTLLHWISGQSTNLEIIASVQKYMDLLEGRRDSEIRLDELLAEHYALMSKSSIPHENLFEFTVQFLYEYRHADTVISFLKLIEAKGGKISNPEFLHQFMLRVLDEDSPFAYHLCRAISALDVSSDPQFPLRSILEALETRHKFQDIIDRAETSQLLPASLKDLPIDELQKAQTVLIHQVAHQYSIDHSRSCRSAQQQVNLLFKYLRARDLPIGPLFTRAVVRVCITRPMMERRWVSRRRVEAICRIVAKVEGTEVAGQVRSTFLDWRGGLITDSHRKLIELGGSGSAHVNTMRRLGLI